VDVGHQFVGVRRDYRKSAYPFTRCRVFPVLPQTAKAERAAILHGDGIGCLAFCPLIGLFGAAAAWTGASEKTLKRIGDKDYEKIYLYPNSHAGYYPGAKPIAMKVIFRKSDGRLLGAQAVGEDNVDKRISALALALQMRATIYDLEEAELCYAPQFGSAKDPVNFAGMVAADVLRGDMPLSQWDSAEKGFLLDVREPVELALENVPGALNIPLGQLRARLGELPRDREILVICRSGQRAYSATRILLQKGFKARNLSGGMLSRTHAENFWSESIQAPNRVTTHRSESIPMAVM